MYSTFLTYLFSLFCWFDCTQHSPGHPRWLAAAKGAAVVVFDLLNVPKYTVVTGIHSVPVTGKSVYDTHTHTQTHTHKHVQSSLHTHTHTHTHTHSYIPLLFIHLEFHLHKSGWYGADLQYAVTCKSCDSTANLFTSRGQSIYSWSRSV